MCQALGVAALFEALAFEFSQPELVLTSNEAWRDKGFLRQLSQYVRTASVCRDCPSNCISGTVIWNALPTFTALTSGHNVLVRRPLRRGCALCHIALHQICADKILSGTLSPGTADHVGRGIVTGSDFIRNSGKRSHKLCACPFAERCVRGRRICSVAAVLPTRRLKLGAHVDRLLGGWRYRRGSSSKPLAANVGNYGVLNSICA